MELEKENMDRGAFELDWNDILVAQPYVLVTYENR